MTQAIRRTQRRLAQQAARKKIADRTVSKPQTVTGIVISPGLVQVKGTYFDAQGAGVPGTVQELVNIGRPSRAFFRPSDISSSTAAAGGRSSGSGSGGAVLPTLTGVPISHSQLLNLDNSDDHPQYLNVLRGDSIYYRQSFIDAHIANPNAHHDKIHELDDNLHHRLSDAAPYTLIGTGSTGQSITRLIASHNAQENPAAILKALNGRVIIEEVTAATQVVTPQITTPSSSYLDLEPENDIRTAATMRSYNWFSGLTGAGINFTNGVADFRKLTVDELFADAFTAAVTKALAGAFIVTKSMSRLAKPFTIPPTGTSAPLQIWDIPGFAGMDAFEPGDEVMLPYFQIGDITPSPPTAVSSVDTNSAGGAGEQGGQTVYVDQAFGSTPGDWTTTGEGNALTTAAGYFSVVNGAWHTSSGGSNFHSHWTGSGASNSTNYRFTGRFRLGVTGSGVGLTVFSSYPSSDSYYRIRSYNNGTMHVSPHGVTSGPNGGTTDSGFNPVANVWNLFKIEVEDAGTQTLIRARFWEEGSSEPSTWQIDCYDSTAGRYTSGTIGVWGYNDQDGVDYDDFLVEALQVSGPTNTILAITKPAGTQSGDLLILAVTHDSTASVTATGFIATDNGTQAGKKLTIFTKIAGSSEPASYTVEMGSADDAGATITALRNVGNSPVADVQIVTGNGTTATSGGLYPALDNSMTVVILAAMNSTALAATPSGTTLSGNTGTLSAESRIGVWHKADQDAGIPSSAYVFDYGTATDYVLAELMITSNPGSSGGGSVAIGRAWATVTEYTTPPEPVEDGAQIWRATIAVDTSAAGYTILADAPVLDYGKNGDGVIEMSTIDPNGSPYVRAYYRGLHAWDTTAYDVIFQAGNIEGTPATGSDGFYTKQRNGTGAGSIELSDSGALIDNVPIRQKYNNKIVAWLEEAQARFGKDINAGQVALAINYATGDVTLGRVTSGGYAKWNETSDTLEIAGKIVIGPSSTGLDNLADGSVYGKVRKTILGDGYIVVGSGTKDSSLYGWAIGEDNEIVGQKNGVDQVVLNLNGEITAGLGRVTLNRDGIGVDVAGGLLTSRRYSFQYPGTNTEVAYLGAVTDNLLSGYPSKIFLAARGGNGGAGQAWLYAYGASDSASNFSNAAPPAYGAALGAATFAAVVRGRGLLIDKDSLHASTVPAGQLRITSDYNTYARAEAEANTGALIFGTQSTAYGPFGGGYVLLRQQQSTNPTVPSGYGALFFGGGGNTLMVKFPNGTIRGIALT